MFDCYIRLISKAGHLFILLKTTGGGGPGAPQHRPPGPLGSGRCCRARRAPGALRSAFLPIPPSRTRRWRRRSAHARRQSASHSANLAQNFVHVVRGHRRVLHVAAVGGADPDGGPRLAVTLTPARLHGRGPRSGLPELCQQLGRTSPGAGLALAHPHRDSFPAPPLWGFLLIGLAAAAAAGCGAGARACRVSPLERGPGSSGRHALEHARCKRRQRAQCSPAPAQWQHIMHLPSRCGAACLSENRFTVQGPTTHRG